MKKKIQKIQTLNSKAFSWCVKNDFQVYIVPTYELGRIGYKIAVRTKGITTEGKDYIIKDGVEVRSKETVGKQIFQTIAEVSDHYNYVIESLMKKYG